MSFRISLLPKIQGGLGVFYINKLAAKLASKWVYRGMDLEDYWAVLIKRNRHKFPYMV